MFVFKIPNRPTLWLPHSVSSPYRAAELRPDLSCLWKLLGDACTAVSAVSPNRAQLLVPAALVGLDSNMQNQVLDQAQALKAGERYDHKQTRSSLKSLHCVCRAVTSLGTNCAGQKSQFLLNVIFTMCINFPFIRTLHEETLHYCCLICLLYFTQFPIYFL